jgi:hypothetical protein
VANPAPLDYETTHAFTLVIRVSDNGAPALSRDASVTVRLTDVAESPTPVIDVKPSDPNIRIVPRRAPTLQVAILSAASFDTRRVAVNSLRFGRTGTEDSLQRKRRGGPQYSLAHVNGDGRAVETTQHGPSLKAGKPCHPVPQAAHSPRPHPGPKKTPTAARREPSPTRFSEIQADQYYSRDASLSSG